LDISGSSELLLVTDFSGEVQDLEHKLDSTSE